MSSKLRRRSQRFADRTECRQLARTEVPQYGLDDEAIEPEIGGTDVQVHAFANCSRP